MEVRNARWLTQEGSIGTQGDTYRTALQMILWVLRDPLPLTYHGTALAAT